MQFACTEIYDTNKHLPTFAYAFRVNFDMSSVSSAMTSGGRIGDNPGETAGGGRNRNGVDVII